MNDKAYCIIIKGIVQGVVFRPHVYRLAVELGLKGWVLNSSAGVFIEIEGSEERLQAFLEKLQQEPPPLADIRSCTKQEIEWTGYADFTIKASDDQEDKTVMVSPDIAICRDCRDEVKNSRDRRFEYPFTNCTNCGPRFTIIKGLPYDRVMTTMSAFPMCQDCQAEYENPLHRRFHAQPNACPVCGPHTTLCDGSGQPVGGDVRDFLKKGYIVAVKGLGGFHLAADARNCEAVTCLRRRKKRDAKPFAVMVRDLETAHKYCRINDEEEKWLTSPQAPIVILDKQEQCALADDIIHPGIDTLGVMLPYTPLHFLLFDDELEILIMTSANISDEPLIIDNQEALDKLKDIADYFLLHNRDIYNPCDDSVMRVTDLQTPHIFRRARGFVPRGIPIAIQTEPVLALGGEMKNTFCITRNGEAFLSQHWGDLNHYHNYVNFQRGMERFKKSLYVEPMMIAHDLHPEYQTSRWAKQQQGIEKIGVQHHFAHMASVMAENALQGEVLGLICDGTGWGTDGAVWGGEILRGDYRDFKRVAHLKYVPYPGGDINARKPYRMGLIYLYTALGEKVPGIADKILPDLTEAEKNLMLSQMKAKTPANLTSSCGRLFDAVGAVLGICGINKYEGQTAAELEARADQTVHGHYGFELRKDQDIWLMDVLPMWPELMAELKQGFSSAAMAQKFHLTLVEMFVATLVRLRDESGLNRVVLSGGVFHNQILLNNMVKRLGEQEFMVYHHRQVPPGDGGLSLGQAIIASEVLQSCVWAYPPK
jgi:hydrogenase maturation protein HypF